VERCGESLGRGGGAGIDLPEAGLRRVPVWREGQRRRRWRWAGNGLGLEKEGSIV
jgi:hypothetical protein